MLQSYRKYLYPNYPWQKYHSVLGCIYFALFLQLCLMLGVLKYPLYAGAYLGEILSISIHLVLTIALGVVLWHEKSPKIYWYFASMVCLTVLGTLWYPHQLSGLMGILSLAPYSFYFFVSTPVLIKGVLYVYEKSPHSIHYLGCVFLALTGGIVIVYNVDTGLNLDFLALTIFVCGLGIFGFEYKYMPHMPPKYKILLGVCILYMFGILFVLDNRTILYAVLGLGSIIMLFLYAVHRVLGKTLYAKTMYLIPVVTLVLGTIMLYILKPYLESSNAFFTLWLRTIFYEVMFVNMSVSDMIFGTGWGSVHMHYQQNIWVDGFMYVSANRELAQNIDYILGLGTYHSHNVLIEYLVSVGILGVGMYVALWVYLGWCVRRSIVALTFLTVYAIINITWFHMFLDMMFIAFVMAGIVVHHGAYISKVSQRIWDGVFGVTAGVLLVFNMGVYFPYMQDLSKDHISVDILQSKWHATNSLDLIHESFIWRRYILETLEFLKKGGIPEEKQVKKFVNILDILKNKSHSGNAKATFEINRFYQYIYGDIYEPSVKSDILEQIRKREYDQWSSVVLRVSDHFKNRPELANDYLLWHYDRNFDTPILEVTERLLAKNPDNAVALYWRARVLTRQGDVKNGTILFKRAFRHNVIRYIVMPYPIYANYKHLSDQQYVPPGW